MGYTTVDPNETVEIRMGASGPAARPPTTVVDIFKKTVKECGSKVSMRCERDGAWKEWTWDGYHADVMKVAKALLALGVKERDAVAIIGFNSPEWVFAWIGAVLIGAMGTGIYATNGADGVAYVVEHSKAKVVVAEGAKQLAKFREVDASRLASVLAFVSYLPEEATPAPIGSAQGMNWAGFLASGAGVSDDDVEKKAGAVVAGQRRSGRHKGDSTSLQRECSARARSGNSTHASRALRAMIARPNISRNERKTAERGAFEVGHVAPFCRPGAARSSTRPARRATPRPS